MIKKVFLLLCLALPVHADPIMQAVHFLIPAAPGSGWDGTARGIGEAMRAAGLVEEVSYENLSGDSGGKAIAKLIETAGQQQQTLLVNSTPIVVHSLQDIYPQTFRDLVPIGSVVADYTAIVVRADSAYTQFAELASQFRRDPASIKVAGGSARGSTDHFVIARAFQLAQGDPRAVTYAAYDGGGKAMAGLLSGEANVLSTGLSEALEMHRTGEVRILAITSAKPIPTIRGVPTLTELGYPLMFANWRGFFAAPGLTEQRYAEMKAMVKAVVDTPAFEEVRARNGWTRLSITGKEFSDYLERQERQIGDLMREVGYLE